MISAIIDSSAEIVVLVLGTCARRVQRSPRRVLQAGSTTTLNEDGGVLGAVIKQLAKHTVWMTGDIVPSRNTEIPGSDVYEVTENFAKEIVQTSIDFSMTDVSKLTDRVQEGIQQSIVEEIVDDLVAQVMASCAERSDSLFQESCASERTVQFWIQDASRRPCASVLNEAHDEKLHFTVWNLLR